MSVKAMSTDEWTKMMREIVSKHRWAIPMRGRKVKYVEPIFDMRSVDIFSVRFRGMFETKEFTIVNRPDDDGTLFDEIMQWLKEGEDK